MSTKTKDEMAATAADLYAARDELEGDDAGEIVELRPGTAPSTVVSVRLSASDLEQVEAAATRAGKKLSTFLRDAALHAAATPADPEQWVQVVTEQLLEAQARLAEAVTAVMEGTSRSGVGAGSALARAVGSGKKIGGGKKSASGAASRSTARKAATTVSKARTVTAAASRAGASKSTTRRRSTDRG